MKIQDSIAMVTGAASGLGKATVSMLLERGAKVIAIDLPGGALDDVVATHALLPIAANVASPEQTQAAFAQSSSSFGVVPRILVNCAGVLGPARVFRIDKATGQARPRDLEAFRRVLEINLVGTFNTIRLFAAGLSDSRDTCTVESEDGERGVIVNTASVAAYEALSGQTAYGASKAGVVSMTLPLARELAPLGIRVMSIAPGTFETGMYEAVPSHTRETLISDVPFPRRPGRPGEFAHMVQAVIENAMMNGSVIRVDGAVRMREPVADRVLSQQR